MAGAKKVKRDVSSLRNTIKWLLSEGDVVETSKVVNPDLEITALQKKLDGGLGLLFRNVKGYDHIQAITNMYANRNVINKMFGWKDEKDRTIQLAKALVKPVPPEIVSKAPVQEVVITDDLDVNKYVLAIRHTALESELTIGSGQTVVVGKYFDGGTHISYNRMNFRWGNIGTFQISPGSHMWQIMTAHYRDKGPIPLTMNFGIPPAAQLAAGSGFDYVVLPKGCDELGVGGAIQGFPLRIVKAKTVDAYALADAELVLEGYLHPRDKRYETREAEEAGVQGKYFFHPEWAGYMGKAYKAPTLHVTAITMRDPKKEKITIWPMGVHTADAQNNDQIIREAAIYELCNRLQPGIIQDVHLPYCLTEWGGCIIQVKKRNKIEEGWQRNFLSAILSCSQGMRLAIAVDTDIDMYSMDDVMWALTTRVNPQNDILNPLPGGRGQTFMPAERMTAGEREWTGANTRFEGGMGIDATVPFGYEQDFHRPVYAVEKVDPNKWFSKAEVARIQSHMKGWVESLARTGR
ncbi:MAG: UbiD family decarboxylase [Thermodesulfobacteriota bacterium]